nr:hypothetical protein [Clostridiales bacterium]
MFSFIHTYTEDSFEGLIKNGLLRRGDGLKLMHKPYMPAPYDFNHIAAAGGDLYNRLSDLRCPFYIDRLQGGIGLPYHYGYSPEIVRAYKELLGDGFWGWQIHEWASNLRSDRNRIREKYSALGIDDDDKRRVFWEKVISGKEDLFLEAMSPLEWSVYPLPADRMELLEAMYRLYAKRSESTGNMLIPADSYYMAPSIEIKHGAKLLLPEVGWQIGGMRRQLAYNRGMAQAAGIRWGIYYECWCYNSACGSLTIPFSLREGQDEWIEDQLHTGSGNDRSPEEREKGGTSRNLQARAWRFAYLSGACAIGEEYGVCNTFRSL